MKHEISCSESGPSTPSKHPPYLTEQHSGKVRGDYEVTPFLSSRIYGGGGVLEEKKKCPRKMGVSMKLKMDAPGSGNIHLKVRPCPNA